jgi:PAS domain S-box-containing protein
LQESEQRFRHLIDSSNDWVWEVDAEGVYTYAGPQCRETLGYEPEELIGKTPFDLMPPDESRRVASIFSAIAAECKAFRALENINMHKDGHLVVLETNGIPVVDKEGRLRGYRGMDRDITERKRAEQALRESEQRFRLVSNAAPVMIWLAGPDKLCTYLNQQWLDFTGRPLEVELGNGWEEDIHPDDLRACLDTYRKAFDKREVFEIRYRLRRRDGEYRWIQDKGVPRFEADGSFAGYIGSCNDVTDRELAAEAIASVGRRLIRAHEEERTWIARELHDDINQRVALLAIELEQWKQRVPESAGDFGAHIEHARHRLFDISKDVQALSHRLHSSKLEYLGIVTAAKSFCRELSDRHKVGVAFTHSDVPATLPHEVSLVLFRVLQEALQNAVKHSHAQDFSVELRGTPGEVCLTVSDAGTGFDQLEAMGTRGLGLISMRERLQLVNGTFVVESSPGHGTTIRACVPIKADVESPEPRQMTG